MDTFNILLNLCDGNPPRGEDFGVTFGVTPIMTFEKR